MVGLWDYDKARNLVKRYGIRSVESSYVKSGDDAVRFADGEPIVLKVLSEKALHKSRSGLIRLNLYTRDDITAAYSDLEKKAQQLRPYKVIAQKMVRGGTEIIIGGNTDQQFGKMILIGLGGIYVETFKDFALRVCPITDFDAQSMLNQMRSKAVIAPSKEAESMVKSLLVSAAKMFAENEITEFDLNPLILHDGTYDSVDLRVMG
ncbi:MAG: acetate--CoA ligase family protein [Candidatus Micrarchaeota archaeon]|nr:acetate--CoA ligase family protein [Candidatus Micrarchaeota archaeon]